jgi:5-formyltetrahydrofolate cyclo-ligase
VERVQQYFLIPADYVIATYFPREDEQNVRLLNFFLQEQGHVMAYPRVEASGSMTFRQVGSTKELELGSFGVMQPVESAPVIYPDLFFVPLVAFDARCHRLGYGKGHCDRALKEARASRNILVIGVGYDMQRIDVIPDEPLDEQLDFVVTEAQIYKAELT